MVIFYDLVTKEITGIEENVMIPALPVGTFDEKKEILSKEGKGFVALPYELGVYTWNYKLCFDEANSFVGLQPKGVI